MSRKLGFTLIEVALFLAITGLLFAGIALGTNTTITRQRYTDSVQNFAEFLRSVYSEVSNPQSVGDGRGDVAIYGKLMVFGETLGLDYTTEVNREGETQRIYVYDVVGDVVGMGTGSATELLKNLKANAVVVVDGDIRKMVEPAGIVEDYMPRWGAGIENTDGDGFVGSILIVRHPRSGTINTLVSDEPIQVNQVIAAANQAFITGGSYDVSNLLTGKLSTFKTETVNFCVNPDWPLEASARTTRHNIRLQENARNASGVEVIDLDGADNECES